MVDFEAEETMKTELESKSPAGLTEDGAREILNAALKEAFKKVAEKQVLVPDQEDMHLFEKDKDGGNFVCTFYRCRYDTEIVTKITANFYLEHMEVSLEIETNVGRFDCNHRIDETAADDLVTDLRVLLLVDAVALEVMFTEWR